MTETLWTPVSGATGAGGTVKPWLKPVPGTSAHQRSELLRGDVCPAFCPRAPAPGAGGVSQEQVGSRGGRRPPTHSEHSHRARPEAGCSLSSEALAQGLVCPVRRDPEGRVCRAGLRGRVSSAAGSP